MKVTVKLFATLRELAGRGEADFEISDETSCEGILLHLQAEIPALGSVLEPCLVAINGRYADKTMQVSDGDEVAILPPMSGG